MGIRSWLSGDTGPERTPLDRAADRNPTAAETHPEMSTGSRSQPDQASHESSAPVVVGMAAYLVDAATSSHLSRTVSGRAKEDVLATALRRARNGERLVLISREDEPWVALWKDGQGWTPESDLAHEFRTSNTLFKELDVGDHFAPYLGFGGMPTITWVKLDEAHAQRSDTGITKEFDPFDTAHLLLKG